MTHCPCCGAPVDIHRRTCPYCDVPYEKDCSDSVYLYYDNKPITIYPLTSKNSFSEAASILEKEELKNEVNQTEKLIEQLERINELYERRKLNPCFASN